MSLSSLLLTPFECIDVNIFSNTVIGMPYAELKKLIYPSPKYKQFVIHKRNGSPRIIHEPRQALKNVQYKILVFLETRSGDPKPCVHGFIKDRSIVTNARKHIEKRPYHLLNLDLENFFPSISFYRIRGVLQNKPFNCSHSVATVIAHICTFNNELPQGAPTSPILSNLVCRSLDRDLMALAKRHRATYTRYADDLTFSFSTKEASRLPANICSFDSGQLSLGKELQTIIETHTFRINPAKSRISTRRHRLEVTGITINELPNVKRIFIDRVRGALNAWSKYGYEMAQSRWELLIATGAASAYEKRPWKRQTRTKKPPQLKNVLWGKLLYIRMVRGKDDVIYNRLAEKYNNLCLLQKEKEPSFKSSSLPIELIVRNAADAEQAVFVVDWSGDYRPTNTKTSEAVGSLGTAFSYKQNNYLITCDHVLDWVGKINGVETTVDSQSPYITNLSLTVHNPTLKETWPVRVVQRDKHRDLAILEFINPPFQLRHFAGMDAEITKNTPGILIGFPNWNVGRKTIQKPARVEDRFLRSKLMRLEIGTLIRQGNSGGPYTNVQFQVAGVAQQGALQDSGNDECLCVTELDTWIASYEASLQNQESNSDN